MSKKRRNFKIKFVRELTEISSWRSQHDEHQCWYELCSYRGLPALVEATLTREFRVEWTNGFNRSYTGKSIVTRRKLGYVNREGEFCFFYNLKINRNHRRYKAARKVFHERSDGLIMWTTTNKDRKGRTSVPAPLYHMFHSIALRLVANKILLGG